MKIGAPGWSRRWTIGSGGFLGEVTLKSTDKFDVVELTDLYVHPQRRRKGCAKQLIQVAVSYADRYRLTLKLRVCPHGNGEKLTASQLRALYKEFDFEGDRQEMLRRFRDP